MWGEDEVSPVRDERACSSSGKQATHVPSQHAIIRLGAILRVGTVWSRGAGGLFGTADEARWRKEVQVSGGGESGSIVGYAWRRQGDEASFLALGGEQGEFDGVRAGSLSPPGRPAQTRRRRSDLQPYFRALHRCLLFSTRNRASHNQSDDCPSSCRERRHTIPSLPLNEA